jgi:hypothetical protein
VTYRSATFVSNPLRIRDKDIAAAVHIFHPSQPANAWESNEVHLLNVLLERFCGIPGERAILRLRCDI